MLSIDGNCGNRQWDNGVDSVGCIRRGSCRGVLAGVSLPGTIKHAGGDVLFSCNLNAPAEFFRTNLANGTPQFIRHTATFSEVPSAPSARALRMI